MGSKMVVVYSSGVILSPLVVSGFPARLLYTSSVFTYISHETRFFNEK